MVVSYLKHRRKASRADVGDISDPNVWIALLFDGADGSSTFTDSSSYARTMTRLGNAQLSTAQKKYGTASGYFDGDTDYIRASGNPQLGTLDWRIEFWFRDDGTADPFARAFQFVDGDIFSSISVNIESSTMKVYATASGGAWDVLGGISIGTVSSGQFDHFCISRNAGTIRTFKNGTQVSIESISPSTDIYYNAAHQLTIGGQSGIDRGAKGWFDDFIIVLNESRTTNFTPASIV